eukprot:5232276-Prymnesium_polylepis.2
MPLSNENTADGDAWAAAREVTDGTGGRGHALRVSRSGAVRAFVVWPRAKNSPVHTPHTHHTC